MPIYEYQCGACQHKFEVIQKVSDKLLTECPECHKQALRKLVTAAAFRLKGSGWYETDFKDKKPKKTTEGNGKSGNDADKNKSTGSDKEKQASSSAANKEDTGKAKAASTSTTPASKSSTD